MAPSEFGVNAAEAIVDAMNLASSARSARKENFAQMYSSPINNSPPKSADVSELSQRLEKQTLLLQTLLMILLEKKVIFEEEFKEWMNYVDELDGRKDGRLGDEKTPRLCKKCGRNSARHQQKCQYCGEEFSAEFLLHKPQS